MTVGVHESSPFLFFVSVFALPGGALGQYLVWRVDLDSSRLVWGGESES